MKKILFIFIVILFWITGYSQTQQEPYRRIGYTTNYGYGFQPYKNASTAFYHNSYTNTNSRVYYPGAVGPRKITVYDGQGNSMETPGGEDDPEGIYMYDESTGKWYYSPNNGDTWYEWREKQWGDGWLSYIIGGIFGGNGTTWRTIKNNPTENTSNWASDPDDPFLTPIGDVPFVLIIGLTLIYILYKANLGDRLSGVRAFNRLKRL